MPYRTQLAVVIAILLLSSAPAWGRPNIEKLVRECTKGKQDACRELRQIAQEDKDFELRREATATLEDQDALAKIAELDENPTVRRAALIRLNKFFSGRDLNGATVDAIGRVALSDHDAENRRDAVALLTDQPLLTNIANVDPNSGVRSAAMSKIHDESMLAKLAISSTTAETRLAALRKVTDKTLVSEIVLQGNDAKVRLMAVDELTDQETLEKIATVSSDPEVRAAAVWKSGAPSLIDKVVKQDTDEHVRDIAQSALWKTVQNEHEVYVWRAPSLNSGGAENSQWIISGALGLAVFSEDASRSAQSAGVNADSVANLLANSNPTPGAARVDEDGRLFLPFAPEDNDDICALVSGALPLNLGTSVRGVPAPLKFEGSKTAEGGVWTISDNQTVMHLQPTLRIAANEALMFGGSYKSSTNTTTNQYVGFNIRFGQLDWTPVSVKGTIRLPPDQVISAGKRFEVKGGAIRFDDTGAFLTLGTSYRGIAN